MTDSRYGLSSQLASLLVQINEVERDKDAQNGWTQGYYQATYVAPLYERFDKLFAELVVANLHELGVLPKKNTCTFCGEEGHEATEHQIPEPKSPIICLGCERARAPIYDCDDCEQYACMHNIHDHPKRLEGALCTLCLPKHTKHIYRGPQDESYRTVPCELCGKAAMASIHKPSQ